MSNQSASPTARHFLLLTAFGFLFLLLGYFTGFVMFEPSIAGDSDWARETIGDLAVQFACCVPMLLPSAITIGMLVAFAASRLHTTMATNLAVAGLANLVCGFISYVPFQYILMFAAAF